MTENYEANDVPNRDNCNEQSGDYLASAAKACASGDLVLGMHLYLAAYERAAADPSIPDGMELTGLREAWNLACSLKERSIAEYVFEKLEPYLTGPEIAACANQLQNLALDRLEEYGFSREELENMAEMISQDLGGDTSVVKVESIAIPNVGMPAVPGMMDMSIAAVTAPKAMPEASAEQAESDSRDEETQRLGVGEAANDAADADDVQEPAKQGKPSHVEMGVASVADFNPYDEFNTSSIGKSYYAATNEGTDSFVFTRDTDRAAAGAKARAERAAAQAQQEPSADSAEKAAHAQADDASAHGGFSKRVADAAADGAKAIQKSAPAAPAKASGSMPSIPEAPEVRAQAPNYATLVGYDDAITVMRDLGVGLQDERAYIDFVNMLNEHHGFDRAPALDTILLRAPVIEDAERFVEATIGEIGLPVLRMSMEDGPQGVPVLCVTTYGNNRPRMNHAHNRFEAPAILVIDDLDTWSMPAAPENVEGIGGWVMANISRGAREAVNLVRAAVEDPDVYVLATASTVGDVDPFFYDMLEPLTVIDIGYPTEKERSDIWNEIARNHPSMRELDREMLVEYSSALPRYDLYMAAREALEDAYKLALIQRTYVPLSTSDVLEKLAACQPLESEEYRMLEDEVVKSFRDDLDHLEDFVDGARS